LGFRTTWDKLRRGDTEFQVAHISDYYDGSIVESDDEADTDDDEDEEEALSSNETESTGSEENDDSSEAEGSEDTNTCSPYTFRCAVCLRFRTGARFVVHERFFQLCPSCEHDIMTENEGVPLPIDFRIMMKCPDPRANQPKAEPSTEQENNDPVAQHLRLIDGRLATQESRLASMESKLEQLLVLLPSSRIVNDS